MTDEVRALTEAAQASGDDASIETAIKRLRAGLDAVKQDPGATEQPSLVTSIKAFQNQAKLAAAKIDIAVENMRSAVPAEIQIVSVDDIPPLVKFSYQYGKMTREELDQAIAGAKLEQLYNHLDLETIKSLAKGFNSCFKGAQSAFTEAKKLLLQQIEQASENGNTDLAMYCHQFLQDYLGDTASFQISVESDFDNLTKDDLENNDDMQKALVLIAIPILSDDAIPNFQALAKKFGEAEFNPPE